MCRPPPTNTRIGGADCRWRWRICRHGRASTISRKFSASRAAARAIEATAMGDSEDPAGRSSARPAAPLVIPRATYRLQFRKEFGFDAAAALAPYQARLGISHIYASPYLKARPGSTHGYDIVDHDRLNPELGDP